MAWQKHQSWPVETNFTTAPTAAATTAATAGGRL